VRIVRSRSSRAQYLIAALLGLAGFVGIALFQSSIVPDRREMRGLIDRPTGGITEHDVPLQVAVHDLVERVGPPTTINVCRTVVNSTVALSGDEVRTLGTALEALASQVGTSVVFAAAGVNAPGLPTIRCPDGRPGDYVTIGSVRPPARAGNE
jgi:hypothetical protein